MRCGTIKYSGALLASVGVFILAALGAVYGWSQVRTQYPFEFSDVSVFLLAGILMLVAGVGMYWFVEE